MDVESLAKKAMALTENQRLDLVNRILSGAESGGCSFSEDLWEMEIRERIRRLNGGETERIPASEVFRKLGERLGE